MMCFLEQTHDDLERDGRYGYYYHYTTPQYEDFRFRNDT